MKYKVVPLFSFVFALVIVSPAFAQWVPDGIPLCTAGNQQDLPKLASDGAGGAIVAWNDSRAGLKAYVRRVTAAGVSLWTPDGFALADSSQDPALIPDGIGGAIIAWTDRRGADHDIYVQRVNAAGVPQWTASGVALCTAPGDQDLPTIASDGSGGAIIAWWGGGVQRVNAAGVPQWTSNGVAFGEGSGYPPLIVTDGIGGAIIAWDDDFSGQAYAQRVDASGTVLWTSSGIALGNVVFGGYMFSVASDGAGGAIVVWSNNDIYAQRVNAAGIPQWTLGGVALCSAAAAQIYPAIVSDGAGGAIVTWDDLRNGFNNHDIFAQRVNAGGVPQWTANGVALCTAANDQFLSTIVGDGGGGAIVAWNDNRNNYHAYTQRVDALGVPQWPADGLTVSVVGVQAYPAMVSDGVGGAIVAWRDNRTNLGDDIYASIVNGNTAAGANVTVTPADATTNTDPVTLTFDNAGAGSTSLSSSASGPPVPGTFDPGDGTYYYLSTTSTHSGNIKVCVTYDQNTIVPPESNVKLLHWDTSLTVPAWVDITTSLDTNLNIVCGETTSLSPFVLATLIPTAVGGAGVTSALYQNVPNPFNPTTTIAFSLREQGFVSLRVYNGSGELVRTLANESLAAGFHTKVWDGRNDTGQPVSSGVYFYKLAAGSFVDTKKMVMLK